jgi:hypothetical protein
MASFSIVASVASFALAAAATQCTPSKLDVLVDAGDFSDHPGAISAAPDAGTEAACAHRQPPSRPNVKDAGGALDLVFVATEYTTGDDAGQPLYQSIGFDLDHSCTGEGQGNSCVEPSWATADHTDGDAGIDNAYGQIWWQQGATVPRATITGATPAEIIRVRSYSGGVEDDQVEVSLYVGRYRLRPCDGSMQCGVGGRSSAGQTGRARRRSAQIAIARRVASLLAWHRSHDRHVRCGGG